MDVGRKRIHIDLAEVERLAGLGLAQEEIALSLGVSLATITRRARDFDDFAEAIKRGKARAGGEVANALFQQALAGNVAAAIWYEKTRRGITEHQELAKRVEELERANRSGTEETNNRS
jgi:hypothetical protein